MSKVPEHPVIPSMIGMLHDVDVSTAKPADKNLLEWDDTRKKWVPGEPTSTIYRSADGSCWKIVVKNDGTTATVKIPCPGTSSAIVVGGLLTSNNAHQSVGNPINSLGSPISVSAGQLLVVIAGHGSNVNTLPATNVSDTLGNVWTEHTSGWSGSSPHSAYFKLSFYTCIVAASGTTTITVHQDGSNFNSAAWVCYSITNHAASPIGVTGTSVSIADSTTGGQTYSQFVTTAGTPAVNSLIIAANINGFYNNGFEPPDPSVYTSDPAFTNLIHYEPSLAWLEFGLRVDTNSGGADSSLWTNVPSPNNGAGSMMLSISYILEVRAA